MKKHVKIETVEKVIIIIATILLLYLLVSLYFKDHLFFHTRINGVDVSLMDREDAENTIRDFMQNYRLLLIERNHETEVISGQDIGFSVKNCDISGIYRHQRSLRWIRSLFYSYDYEKKDLFSCRKTLLSAAINSLDCINQSMVSPKNVDFIYKDGSYEIRAEVYGNKINKDQLAASICQTVFRGGTILDLEVSQCYENPKYTLQSRKTPITRKLLNKYVSTKVYYRFGRKTELLDGNIISGWLSVDDNLEVVINEAKIEDYVSSLAKEYDSVGISRKFYTSTGKTVDVKGGYYGWMINQDEEAMAIIEHIRQGEITEKEPAYSMTALSREGNEIGDTYVEINITKQYLWFYKERKLVAGGAVVTGNPNRGYATALGTFNVIYKQRDATLTGPGYEAKVTYWMPFYGGMGIHDASWRSRFGGEIYKRNGSHGCVNAPYILAKTIFENITEGTPVICYVE